MTETSADAGCPPESEFVRMATGSIEPSGRVRLLEHADGCVDCHELLAQVLRAGVSVADADTVVAADRKRRRGPRPEPGTTIDHYVVIDFLGAGAMGEVVRARDTVLGREVAIKLLGRLPGARFEDRLVREARAMARLSHPNVVTVYGVGEYHPPSGARRVYVAMELIVGTTLRKWCDATSRPWREVLGAWLAAGDGLAAAHAAGIVHRDFKPDNVLVGDDGRVRVGDFGLAADDGTRTGDVSIDTLSSQEVPLSDPLTRTGEVMGTPRFMAPEQLRAGSVDTRADQFAFGVSLYYALWGRYPYDGSSLEALLNRYSTPPAPPPSGGEVPEAVWEALRPSLSPDPDERYPTMDALLAGLRSVLGRRRRRRLVLATAAIGVVGLGGGAAFTELLQERPCDHIEAQMRGVWDPARRQQLDDALAEPEVFAGVAERVDLFVDKWERAAVEVCRATHVQETQPEALMQLRMRCLDGGRRKLQALLDVLTSREDSNMRANAVLAADALPEPGVCRTETRRLTMEEGGAVRAEIDQLDALHSVGLWAEASELGEGLLDRVQTAWGRARVRAVLADVYVNAVELERAHEVIREGLLDAAEAEDDDLAASLWIELVWVAMQAEDRPAQAERLKAAEVAVRRAGNASDLRLRLTLLRTQFHHQRSEPELAYAAAQEALRLATEHGSPLGRANALSVMASPLYAMGRTEEAIEAARGNAEIMRAELGAEHPHVARADLQLAGLYVTAGRHVEGRELLAHAIESAERAGGQDGMLAATVLSALAVADVELGSYELAVEEADRVVAMFRNSSRPNAGAATSAMTVKAHALSLLGRHEEALAAIEDALAGDLSRVGADHSSNAITIIARGEIKRRAGMHESALVDFERALDLSLPSTMAEAYAWTGVGQAQVGLGRHEAAREALERAVAMHRKLGTDPKDLAEAEESLAEAQAALAHARAN